MKSWFHIKCSKNTFLVFLIFFFHKSRIILQYIDKSNHDYLKYCFCLKICKDMLQFFNFSAHKSTIIQYRWIETLLHEVFVLSLKFQWQYSHFFSISLFINRDPLMNPTYISWKIDFVSKRSQGQHFHLVSRKVNMIN